MNTLLVESPLDEQEICVGCGLCCDGTLFNHAVLQPGEQGNLPVEIEQRYGREGEYEFFTLPCAYFCGKCTIYGQKRASICSDFRCQLLINFSANKLTKANAIKVVDNALIYKTEIYQLYKQIFGRHYTLSFRNLLIELGKYTETMPENDPLKTSIELLRTKCIIFETLLIKNFKSLKNFEQMISTPIELPTSA